MKWKWEYAIPLHGLFAAGRDAFKEYVLPNTPSAMADKQIAYQEEAQKEQNEANLQITHEYNKGQMQLAEHQNQYNTEMWNKQNEYNSPAATMQRLVQAGINPRAYQQIGQFANAGTPAPAATPEQKMREYVSPKLASAQARMQKLDIYNATQERRLRALNLTSDVIHAERSLREQKRHNGVMEQLADQKGQREYTKLEATLLRDFGIRIMNPAQPSINGLMSNNMIELDIPQWVYNLSQREKVAYVENLEQSLGVTKAKLEKMGVEKEYLQLKKDLETVKTGNAVLDTIVKLLIHIF